MIELELNLIVMELLSNKDDKNKFKEILTKNKKVILDMLWDCLERPDDYEGFDEYFYVDDYRHELNYYFRKRIKNIFEFMWDHNWKMDYNRFIELYGIFYGDFDSTISGYIERNFDGQTDKTEFKTFDEYWELWSEIYEGKFLYDWDLNWNRCGYNDYNINLNIFKECDIGIGDFLNSWSKYKFDFYIDENCDYEFDNTIYGYEEKVDEEMEKKQKEVFERFFNNEKEYQPEIKSSLFVFFDSVKEYLHRINVKLLKIF